MANFDVVSPVWKETLWRRRVWLLVLALLLLVVVVAAAYLYWRLNANEPVDYADDREHFKYGSIGSEEGHVPYRIWKVLPAVFPEYLPDRPGEGYERFGFITEEGKDTPIGFSKRRAHGLELVGINCAACHTGTVRAAPGAPRILVLGMPAHRLDVLAYFRFLFRCATDERFTEQVLLAAIEKDGGLGFIDRFVEKAAIAQTREGILRTRFRMRYLGDPENFGLRTPEGTPVRYPDWGPGRVDTTNALKALRLGWDMRQESWVSFNDLPSIWNQEPRKDMGLHWDGNNNSLDERNLSAAMGAGAYPTTLDIPRIQRVAAWCRTLRPPDYPFAVDDAAAAKGKPIYDQHCKSCHSFSGTEVGKVTPIDEIRTDPHRFNSASPAFICDANKLGSTELNAFLPDGYKVPRDLPWRFSHFHKTAGYANTPLDGVWARAPYLHNGSVPRMRDLLTPAAKRPVVFYKGSDVYDQTNLGFITDKRGDNYFEFDTRLSGNDNGGHEYAVNLKDEEKDWLIEYLKRIGAAE
jgi:mono/diheme cytochrome c family protein